MKKLLFIAITALLPFCASAQDITPLTAKQIVAMPQSADTVYVFNFWATWCAPCIQELGEFDDLAKQYNGKAVKILMVSLDFKDTYPYKLQGFVKRKRMIPAVAWLNETDANAFVPEIDENWGGSIPATLIIRPGTGRKFVEGQVNYSQLSAIVSRMLIEQ